MSFLKKLLGLDKLKDQAGRINDYFANAVKVYSLKGEMDARVAALAAAKSADSLQRESMVDYLSGMASDMEESIPDPIFANTMKDRLLGLKVDIEAKNWTIKDIIKEKGNLDSLNKDYLIALGKADPSVFLKYHPDLFKLES